MEISLTYLQTYSEKKGNPINISVNIVAPYSIRYMETVTTEELFKHTSRTQNIIDCQLNLLKRITGIKYTSYQIRASRIIAWLKHYNIRQVQYMGGFKSISAVERYRMQDIEGLREEVEKFHPMG